MPQRVHGKMGNGIWYKMIRDPDGNAHFYGMISARSITGRGTRVTAWLPGTRFRKYAFGKPQGEYEVRGNELVSV